MPERLGFRDRRRPHLPRPLAAPRAARRLRRRLHGPLLRDPQRRARRGRRGAEGAAAQERRVPRQPPDLLPRGDRVLRPRLRPPPDAAREPDRALLGRRGDDEAEPAHEADDARGRRDLQAQLPRGRRGRAGARWTWTASRASRRRSRTAGCCTSPPARRRRARRCAAASRACCTTRKAVALPMRVDGFRELLLHKQVPGKLFKQCSLKIHPPLPLDDFYAAPYQKSAGTRVLRDAGADDRRPAGLTSEEEAMDDREPLEKRVAELEKQVAAFRGGGLFPLRGIRKRADWGIGDIPFYDIAFGADPERGELRGHAQGHRRDRGPRDGRPGARRAGARRRRVRRARGGALQLRRALARPLSAIGGLAIGGLALGGAAVGGAAIGGGAAGYYACGGGAHGHPRGRRDAPRPRSRGVLPRARPRGRLRLGPLPRPLSGGAMTTYVALLRGINVGGHNMVAMAGAAQALRAARARGRGHAAAERQRRLPSASARRCERSRRGSSRRRRRGSA